MQGKPVTIRTMDFGCDKLPEALPTEMTKKLAFGMRGIRLCLQYPTLFKTQLRAIYRASVYGQLKIMLPMITSLTEIKETKLLLEEVRTELDAEDILYDKDLKLGIMIETPAAVMLSSELIKEVDFFSIGTNDLTQYLLGIDRQMAKPSDIYSDCHPAVLTAIRTVTANAHLEGKPDSICGELAANGDMLAKFLNIEIDSLSVATDKIHYLHKKLRGLL